MHLSHTIPWNNASRHFEFVANNKAYYGHHTGLFPKQDERQVSDIMHFVRVFVDAVDEFAVTERKKFPAKMDQTAPLFDDTLLDEEKFHLLPYSSNDNRCIPLSEDMQSVDFWKAEASDGTYCTSHGYLADAVKFLIQQQQSRALLTLCQAVPLSNLFNLSWGHGFGVYLQAYHSFRIYVYVNLVYSVQQDLLVKGKKSFKTFDVQGLRREVLELLSNYDYSSQLISHRHFWEKYVENPTYSGEDTVFKDPAEVNPAELKQYLANCFRDIYLYDMILKECGCKDTKSFWMRDIILTMNFMFQPLSLPEPKWDSS
jgi:hypothetical protein